MLFFRRCCGERVSGNTKMEGWVNVAKKSHLYNIFHLLSQRILRLVRTPASKLRNHYAAGVHQSWILAFATAQHRKAHLRT